MRKIVTLFRRNPEDRRFVIPEVQEGADWVLAGEGVATRKLDGTCVLFDPDLDPTVVPAVGELHGWWTRREVKPGAAYPVNFVEVDRDPVTGKAVGWEPAEESSFARFLAEAVAALRDGPRVGTHELIGPRINRNPEGVDRHLVVAHADAERLDAPRDFDGLARWLHQQPYEGVVWHHEDAVRMVKIKRRDFPRRG